MTYEILGLYKFNEVEVIDTAPSRLEAIRLVNEYRMAFGNDSIVYLSNRACKDYHSQNYREDIL